MKTVRRLVGVSLLVLCGAAPAWAGNILITGHDSDAHDATEFGTWALNYLLNDGNGAAPGDVTARIGYLGNDEAPLASYLGPYDNFAFYDLDSPTWTDAFTDGNSVLIVGSGFDYVSPAGSAALNAQASAFASYFNAGGNLLVNTEQGIGQSFYGFIPNFGGTLANSLPGCFVENGSGDCMQPTAAGIAAGHTIAQIVDANITHTRFTGIDDEVFTVLSIYNNSGGAGTGTAITFGLVDGSITDGGFEDGDVPEPASLLLLGTGLLVALRRRRC